MIKIWVIIVNYKTAHLVVNCLRSIAAQISDSERLHTLVVDNASPDGSVDTLLSALKHEQWENWASVLPLDRNGGFAFGCNAGILKALESAPSPCYVMLLNPDTIVHKDAIQNLIQFMDENEDAGIAGSLLENADGYAEPSAHTAFSPLGEFESGARLGILTKLLHRYAVTPPIEKAAHECDWVSGASLIIRKKVFDTVGLLDENFFLYFEEADFCLRTKQAGWKIWYAPKSRVFHMEGASTGIKNTLQRRPQYWYNSRRRYFVKHFGIFGLVFSDLLWAIGRLSLAVRRGLGLGSGGNKKDSKFFAFDLLWGDLSALVTGQIFRIDRKTKSP